MYRDYKDRSFGPLIEQFPELRKYVEISNRAHKQCARLSDANPQIVSQPANRIINSLMFQADGTSYSVRALTALGQSLEALALLRTRLEQLIVCSYLIHADVEDGLLPFAQDIRRSELRALNFLKSDEEFYQLIEALLSDKIQEVKREVIEQEQQIDPDFDYKNDKLPRKWTKMSTFDMALHRDRMVPEEHPMSKLNLQRYYQTTYRTGSIFVHSDSATVGSSFLTVKEISSQPQLGPPVAYIFTNLMQCAQFDIIQCYEALDFYGLDATSYYVGLQDEYEDLLAHDWGLSDLK